MRKLRVQPLEVLVGALPLQKETARAAKQPVWSQMGHAATRKVAIVGGDPAVDGHCKQQRSGGQKNEGSQHYGSGLIKSAACVCAL